MSKVAINGRRLPLAPLAGGLAGLIAFAAFMVLPQEILQAVLWQTRLTTALAAACFAAGLTALLAWKLGSGKRSQDEDEAQAFVPAPVVDVAPARYAPPATVEPDEESEKGPSLLGRLRRKKQEEEVDLDAMPMTRRRGVLAEAAAPASIFAEEEPYQDAEVYAPHDAQQSGHSLLMTKGAPVQMREQPYEEGHNYAQFESSPQSYAADAVHPAVAALSPPLALDPEPEAKVIAAVRNYRDGLAPESAGTENWSDPNNFDQYDGALELTADAVAAEPEQTLAWQTTPESQSRDAGMDEARQTEAAPYETPAFEAQPYDAQSYEPQRYEAQPYEVPAYEVESFEAHTLADIPPETPLADYAQTYPANHAFAAEPTTEQGYDPAPPAIFEPAAEPAQAAAIEPVAPSAQTVDAVGRVDTDMAHSPVYPALAPEPVADTAQTSAETASVAELMARLQVGLEQRAARRADVVAADTAPASYTEASDASLAHLADKEAEVDEALRAALTTLERMNRRATG